MSFASPKYSREIRLEAALFICSMCRTSLLTVSARFWYLPNWGAALTPLL